MKKITYLKDYQAPLYRVAKIDLTLDLDPQQTRVTATLNIVAQTTAAKTPLILDGEHLQLVSVKLDGTILAKDTYQVSDVALTIFNVPERFTLQIENLITPQTNTRLEGLFVSGSNLVTQCEPQGFRNITYFIDRPDNLSLFTTTLIADKQAYPVLLSNGNCIQQGNCENNRHFATWQDPFLKPSYLFALVAGKLDVLEDEFVTMCGRKVALKLYVDPGQLDKADHAMQCLKQAMRWDEQCYGREYDLDIFMIVAVRDFNMGAMENKGLNIFNSKYILANPKTATDVDYENILGVVGHEYFHNWSGDRVTCRDWFQLSLKEGFTVYRDQTFTANYTSEAVKRIDDVNLLRTSQFTEDAGPTAHPVQPASYLEINNFYTMTIYHKGAEVIRMLHTLLGAAKFRQGTDLYFQRHDGQAVTIEEFVSAMEDAGKIDLKQFRLWYSQAGTPILNITEKYSPEQQQYQLTVEQQHMPSPDQPHKAAMHIPLAIGLLDQQGKEIVATTVLNITQTQQQFLFNNIASKPVPSLLRGFSAPVKLNFSYTKPELALLLAHDTDVFARYEAAQRYAILQLQALQQSCAEGEQLQADADYLATLRQVTQAKFSDAALQALLLNLPSEKYLVSLTTQANPDIIHTAREFLRLAIAAALKTEFEHLYHASVIAGGYVNNAVNNGKRRLKNTALNYLTLLDQGELAWQQFNNANNMTDSLSALSSLANCDSPHRVSALDIFYQRWQADPNVLDKWFAVQATSILPGTLDQVKKLMQLADFSAQNPNAIRALIGAFTSGNLAQFHAADGSGYRFLTEQVLRVDQFNPHLAANLVMPLLHWQQYDLARQQLMCDELQKIIAVKELSKNTYEQVSKGLVA